MKNFEKLKKKHYIFSYFLYAFTYSKMFSNNYKVSIFFSLRLVGVSLFLLIGFIIGIIESSELEIMHVKGINNSLSTLESL